MAGMPIATYGLPACRNSVFPNTPPRDVAPDVPKQMGYARQHLKNRAEKNGRAAGDKTATNFQIPEVQENTQISRTNKRIDLKLREDQNHDFLDKIS